MSSRLDLAIGSISPSGLSSVCKYLLHFQSWCLAYKSQMVGMDLLLLIWRSGMSETDFHIDNMVSIYKVGQIHASDSDNNMRIIIRREPDFQNRHYCLLEFSGVFEGHEQQREMMQLGLLTKVDPTKMKDKANYILEIGTTDISGFDVKTLNDKFLHVETIEKSGDQQVLIVKGIVTKKIIFNKRPYPNMDRAAEMKPATEKFKMFKKN